VLIQAWQHYYSPSICNDYWTILDELGQADRIFIPEEVFGEITNTEDELSEWLKKSSIPVRSTTSSVISRWQAILAANPDHKLLVDNIKGRSLADPWVVSHAMDAGATVVTKEQPLTAANSKRIKIPNVCDNMNIPWIDDFTFVRRIGLKFSCSI
jgi:hypothetical protein